MLFSILFKQMSSMVIAWMEMKHRTMLGLCLSFIFLNILDAVTTIIVIENKLGGEHLGIMSFMIETLGIYNAMALKIISVSIVMYMIYTMDGKYDTISFKKHSIKGITLVYVGLVFVNTIYILIVLNGLIVIFFPAFALIKSN